jgi:hypothetical protein
VRGGLDLQPGKATPAAGEPRRPECALDFDRGEVQRRSSSWKKKERESFGEGGDRERRERRKRWGRRRSEPVEEDQAVKNVAVMCR